MTPMRACSSGFRLFRGGVVKGYLREILFAPMRPASERASRVTDAAGTEHRSRRKRDNHSGVAFSPFSMFRPHSRNSHLSPDTLVRFRVGRSLLDCYQHFAYIVEDACPNTLGQNGRDRLHVQAGYRKYDLFPVSLVWAASLGIPPDEYPVPRTCLRCDFPGCTAAFRKKIGCTFRQPS